MDHHITICTSCRHLGTACRPGYELIARLRAAITTAGDAVTDSFEVSGVACMAGCDRPCTVAYHGTRKATYLFGDIDPDTDIEDLLAFARLYADLEDGWCSSLDRPGKLRDTTLARVPAAMLAIETGKVRAS
ncbi:DUF1636 domain-containing protein [uncultured Tateyamaria sp.]|uniref:DUF1636 domain-containing protein n=1 Tax=uncultured Tateyamaria sp. TaxID=455651 RepID=UPI002623D116|nr:DUF1636 domain-containing protein [uncultured Tateyamaria sp.]